MNLLQIGLHHYLVISAILFTLGMFAVLTRRNAIAMLMGIELILNSCSINFVAFSRFIEDGGIHGQVFAIFVIMLAAAEAAIMLAIIIAIYRRFGAISPDETDSLRG
ncbi:TPA: NADH-quinone oxidoreductase subunit NuoK [Candidatus Poribacteria bacterium]|nr:NADH-quinone oxidoreductase subunit NuoK [Candidatus Poribacteria bacterium]